MQAVNIHDAKTQLSRLVDQAAAGEPFIIAKAGKPLVKVVPLTAADLPGKRRVGFMAGEIQVPEDFDHLGGDEVVGLFEGGA